MCAARCASRRDHTEVRLRMCCVARSTPCLCVQCDGQHTVCMYIGGSAARWESRPLGRGGTCTACYAIMLIACTMKVQSPTTRCVAGLRSDDDNIMESLRLAANACIGVGDPQIDGRTLTFPCTALGWSSMISKLLCSLTL